METWAIFMIIGIFIWPFFIVGLILLIVKSAKKNDLPPYVTVRVNSEEQTDENHEEQSL